MIYKNFGDLKLSALGMGAMRFPTLDGDDSKIDEVKSKEIIAYAMANGINYYDTAWIYHHGNSEILLGKFLREYPRDSYYIATKFPGWDEESVGKVKEVFEKQLEKTGMEYFDFYLYHNVSEKNVDLYTDEKYGVHKYLMEQKKNGRIKHLGFSAHASVTTMRKFLDAYGKDMEFCQIQLNWIDYTYQDAKAKIELLNEYGVPVWVMEPVRGGKLAALAPQFAEKLDKILPGMRAPEAAFRFLQSIPEVCVTLSGMSNLEQIVENVATYAEEKPLTKEQFDALVALGREMSDKGTVPCTACRYCTEHCPQGLDIPALLELYNRLSFDGTKVRDTIAALELDKRPSACVRCQACEAVCPQEIKISKTLSGFSGMLA